MLHGHVTATHNLIWICRRFCRQIRAGDHNRGSRLLVRLLPPGTTEPVLCCPGNGSCQCVWADIILMHCLWMVSQLHWVPVHHFLHPLSWLSRPQVLRKGLLRQISHRRRKQGCFGCWCTLSMPPYNGWSLMYLVHPY